MNQRKVGTLLIAAVAVIALALYLSASNSGRSGDSLTAGAPVLPGLRSSLNSITEVRLIKGDGTRTTLKKREKDWVVAERDFRADSGRVRKLLLDLSDLSVVEEKTRDPANYAKLGVEDVKGPNASGTRVELVDPGAKKNVALIVGKSAGAKSNYVRVPDTEQSLLAGPQIAVETDPRRWLDRTVVDILQDRVKEVAVTPASGPAYTLTRASKDQSDFTVPNLPKGRELSSPGAVNSVAGALASLSLDDVRKADATAADGEKTAAAAKPAKADGAGAPARASFQTFDGLVVDVTGRKDGEQHLITLNAHSNAKEADAEAQKLNASLKGWEFEIPAYKYDSLFRPLEESLAKVEDKKKS
jgi:hypothetical protein